MGGVAWEDKQRFAEFETSVRRKLRWRFSVKREIVRQARRMALPGCGWRYTCSRCGWDSLGPGWLHRAIAHLWNEVT